MLLRNLENLNPRFTRDEGTWDKYVIILNCLHYSVTSDQKYQNYFDEQIYKVVYIRNF